MAWWASTNIELKVKSKFLVSIAGTFYLPNVKTVTKPSCDIDIKEHKLINHVFRYPGTLKWNPITITFVDMNGNGDTFDTSELLMQMLNNTGYNIPEEANHAISAIGETKRALSSPEKSSTIANSFGPGLTGEADFSEAKNGAQNMRIVQISPDGEPVEEWTLVNPLIQSIKFGDLTYDSDDAVEYQLEIAYDYAKFGAL